jgi:hypothetical protein
MCKRRDFQTRPRHWTDKNYQHCPLFTRSFQSRLNICHGPVCVGFVVEKTAFRQFSRAVRSSGFHRQYHSKGVP